MSAGGDGTAFEAGQRVGGLVWALVFLGLLLKQVKRLKDPGVNRKGAWSALLAYAGIIGIQGARLIQEWSESPAARIGPVVLCVAVFVVAIVLGVQGMLEVRAQKKAGAFPDPGGARAGVILSALAIVAMSVGLFSALGRGGVPAELGPTAKAVELRDEKLNFAFAPPEGWSPLDAKKLNPMAAGVWVLPRAQIYFMLIAESGVEMDDAELADASETNMKTGSDGATVNERGPHAVGGLNGIRFASTVRKGKLDLAFVHWVHAGDGWAYQLMTWGAANQAAEVARLAETLLPRFRILDPKRRPEAAPPPPPERRWSFRSPAWRYRLDLDRSVFSEWKGLKEDWPKADFGARCGDGCAIGVFPLGLPDDPPGVDAVARALIDMVALEFPGDGFTGRRAVRVGSAEGFEVTFADRRKGADPWDWRLRVLVDGRRAWLVAGFSRGDAADLAAKRDAGLAAVTFEAGGDAPPPEPASAKERARQARALNEMGVHEYELEQYVRATALFTAASRLAPGDRVLLKNAADGHAKAGLFAEGLALVDAAPQRLRADLQIAAVRALLASRAGREAEALRDYPALFARGLVDEEQLERYAELLEEKERRAEAVAFVAAYRRRHDGVDALLLHSELLERSGKARAANDLLKGAYRRRGEPVVGYRWVAGMLDAGRKAESLREAQALVKRFPAVGAMYRLRGRCQLALGRYAESKGSFETALEHDPTDGSAREYLDHVSAQMGEGQNSLLKEPIEEVAVPAGLLGPAPAGSAPEGYGAWYAERLVAIAFRKGKETRRTDLWRGRAVDAAGVERLGTFDLEFDPLSEQIFVNRVVVRDGKGREVARGKPGDWYVSDQATGSLGTWRHNLHVQVNGLRPGYDVEVVVTRRDGSPSDRFDFMEEPLAATLPRLRSALVVTGDVDAIASVASPGVETRKAPGALAFLASGREVFRAEPMRQDHQEWLPTVWLGPAGASWAAEAQEYEKEIAATDKPDRAVDAVATAEAAGRTSADAKLFALARWVQRGITYRALEFGRRAHVPHALAEIVKNRFGDCKDHALLLKRLLEAQGVTARLALVRTSGPVRPELASVDQFDHMIVYVPGVGGGTFVDATDKGSPPGAPPSGLGGKQALILDGAQSKLVALPQERPGRIDTQRQVALDGEGLDVREKVRLEGPTASGMRAFLASTDPAERAEALQGFLAKEAAGLRVTSLRVEALDDLEKPLTLEVRYLLRDRRRGAGAVALPNPAVWERSYLAAEPVPRRESPFEVTALDVKSVVELRPSKGQAVAAVPDAAPGKGAFARWERSARQDGAGLKLDATMSRQAGRYPAQRWGDFVEEMERALAAVEVPLSVR